MIKFTPDKGTITIDVESVVDEKIGPSEELRVNDTGIGFDEPNLEIIFEKLHQLADVELPSSGCTKAKGGGPGLGLAIAAGVIKAHDGKIWAESPGYDEKKMSGSTFIIRLPLATEKVKP